MKPRRVENWTVEKLHKSRPKISFPEFQRQPNLWSTEKKRLLIDSILRDIDIPKIYFNENKDKSIEVVDGSQRLWSIWEFIDDEFSYDIDGESKKFSQLTRKQRDTVRLYELQITIFEDVEDDYLRELFLRLQLGLLLVTGEKLNAATGAMREFVFEKLAKHKFIHKLKITNRRFAKETLGAQISINSFRRRKLGTFARTRYEDLLFFFKEYEHPLGQDLLFFQNQSRRILKVLDGLSECFGDRTGELSNRSYVLSVYLFFESLADAEGRIPSSDRRIFPEFIFGFWKRLKQEVASGIDRTNRELYAFETMLSSASGEKYQIARRHEKLVAYYEHFKQTKEIKGD